MTDEKPRRGRPPTGVTPVRHIRIGDELWDAIKEAAEDRRETATTLIIRAAERELHRLRRAKASE